MMTLKQLWHLTKRSFAHFFTADAVSRGAALAFYAVTSLVPVLVIAIGIAGAVYGEEAARGAVVRELRVFIGNAGAELVQNAILTAFRNSGGGLASLLGLLTLIITSSGVFVELRRGLNAIWHVEPPVEDFWHFVISRVASLALVVALGFLLLGSLVLDAVLTGFRDAVNAYIPLGSSFISSVNFVVSFLVVTILLFAIYEIMIFRRISFRHALVGAVLTALLFQIGKVLIGTYVGSSGIASSFGAAGALIGLLFWIYYSAQIIFFGAAITRAYTLMRAAEQRIEQRKASSE